MYLIWHARPIPPQGDYTAKVQASRGIVGLVHLSMSHTLWKPQAFSLGVDTYRGGRHAIYVSTCVIQYDANHGWTAVFGTPFCTISVEWLQTTYNRNFWAHILTLPPCKADAFTRQHSLRLYQDLWHFTHKSIHKLVKVLNSNLFAYILVSNAIDWLGTKEHTIG